MNSAPSADPWRERGTILPPPPGQIRIKKFFLPRRSLKRLHKSANVQCARLARELRAVDPTTMPSRRAERAMEHHLAQMLKLEKLLPRSILKALEESWSPQLYVLALELLAVEFEGQHTWAPSLRSPTKRLRRRLKKLLACHRQAPSRPLATLRESWLPPPPLAPVVAHAPPRTRLPVREAEAWAM